VAELENWDDARRTYSFRGISGLLPVSNYRGTVSVIEEGAGSALMLSASYDASGVSDAEAKKIIDGNLFFSLCIASPLACTNDQRPVPAAERVDFEGTSLTGRLMLKGYLRRPAGAGPFPAVVLLPGCGGSAEPLDQNWGGCGLPNGAMSL
jgi:hypothetical protein